MNSSSIYTASTNDEKDILHFLKTNPSGGWMELRLDREPSFFQSVEVEGITNDTIIGKNLQTAEIIGIGSRSEKKCYINGKENRIGYLGGLRISSEYRNSLFLYRGYAYLKELHKKGQTKLYLTTIMDGNHTAKKILTSRRESLPIYHNIGNYQTYIVNSKALKKIQPTHSNIFTKYAKKEDIPQILDFFQQTSNSRQFFPLYTEADILSHVGILRGLEYSDILLAFEKDSLVGTVALWNQIKFRRWIIDKYNYFIKAFRPLYNIIAKIQNAPILPKEGSILDYKILSLVKIKNDRKDIWETILSSLYLHNANKQQLIMAGFHEKDPLAHTFHKIPSWKFLSTLYCVYWEDEKAFFDSLNNEVPYLELGSL